MAPVNCTSVSKEKPSAVSGPHSRFSSSRSASICRPRSSSGFAAFSRSMENSVPIGRLDDLAGCPVPDPSDSSADNLAQFFKLYGIFLLRSGNQIKQCIVPVIAQRRTGRASKRTCRFPRRPAVSRMARRIWCIRSLGAASPRECVELGRQSRGRTRRGSAGCAATSMTAAFSLETLAQSVTASPIMSKGQIYQKLGKIFGAFYL